MIWGKRYKSVVVMSTRSDQAGPEIHLLKGKGTTAGKIQALLSGQGFTPEIGSTSSPDRARLLEALLAEEPHEVTELILNTGMSEREYRQVGLCLEVLREQDVLVICLDDKANHKGKSGLSSLHDRRLREMLSGWEQDQKWGAVMSLKGDAPGSAQTNRLYHPT